MALDQRLSNDEFFSQLAELFNYRKGKDHGMIYLSQKRLSHGSSLPAASESNPFPDLNPGRPLPILVRATNGKSKARRGAKVKLSTVVEADGLEAFYARYADVCKAGMTALKPRDRSKKKAKAKKKKGGGGPS